MKIQQLSINLFDEALETKHIATSNYDPACVPWHIFWMRKQFYSLHTAKLGQMP